jgi:hypothetical protein
MWMFRLLAVLAIIVAIASYESSAAVAQDMREVLAPTGKLRVGAYPGSPLSMV